VRVRYSETGGPDGRNLTCTLELGSSALTTGETEELHQLLDGADLSGFHALPHIVGQDAVLYVLEVDGGSADTKQLRVNNLQVWPALSPLIEFLHARAH